MAKPDQIWSLLVDSDKIKQWCPMIRTIRLTGEQQGGTGTRFYFEEKAVGRILKLHMVVTEWVENTRVTFEMADGNLVKGYTQKYVIETAGQSSLISIYEEVKLPYGIIGHIAGLFRRPVSNGHLDRMLANLKHLAETAKNDEKTPNR